MDSTSSTSRFRFRDHLEGVPQSSGSDHSSDISSVSSEPGYDSEPESMTGKGIKRLCSELLELKTASDEEFHRSIYSNYSAFVRLFQELEGTGKELLQLKEHISTHKRLTKDLSDGVFLMNVSIPSTELNIEDPFYANDSTANELEGRVNQVLEVLDSLLIERRYDEAMSVIEMEEVTVKRLQLEENCSSDALSTYEATIYERKAMLANQFTLLAENPRTPAPDLQKALVGLNKLGESRAARRLLLSYYRSRLATGINHFQSSNSAADGLYMRDLSKFVFSMIAQAASSFRSLYGETSDASEFVQSVCQEAEIFASCFTKYAKSIADINGGLPKVVDAVKSTLKFCNLLDTKRVVLHPCLIQHIKPSIEEVLRVHIGHLKKVIGICASNDTWVLSRYLVSGILPRGCFPMVTDQQLKFCHFTNSGRMFITLLRTTVEDISPLAVLEIESSIIRGLTDLFMEYIDILEKSMTCEATTAGEDDWVNFSESMPQRVSILINISTLVLFFPYIVKDTFINIDPLNDEMKCLGDGSRQKELDEYLLLVQEASGRVRAHFYQLFIDNIMLVEDNSRVTSETHVGAQADSNSFNDRMPSTAFQVLFLELLKLEKFTEDNAVEMDWLIELLAELIETIIVSICNDKDIWEVIDDDITIQHFGNFKQFVIDMHFLVEVARHGGYLSDNILSASMSLVSDMESAFLSAGLDPKRDVVDDQWAAKAAADAIQRLLQNELHPVEVSTMTAHEEVQSEICCSDDGADRALDRGNVFKEDDLGDADTTPKICNEIKEDNPVKIESQNDAYSEKESSSEETLSAQEDAADRSLIIPGSKPPSIEDRISMLQANSIHGVEEHVCNTEAQTDKVVTSEEVANSTGEPIKPFCINARKYFETHSSVANKKTSEFASSSPTEPGWRDVVTNAGKDEDVIDESSPLENWNLLKLRATI